jgi:hypothetical protein
MIGDRLRKSMSAGMIRKAIATFKSGRHPQKPGFFKKPGFLIPDKKRVIAIAHLSI